MFRKLAKFATATAILAGGMYAADQLYFRLVHNSLPDKLTNWFAMNAIRSNSYRYGVGAAGAIVLVPLISGLVGLGNKSPIKTEASPLK